MEFSFECAGKSVVLFMYCSELFLTSRRSFVSHASSPSRPQICPETSHRGYREETPKFRLRGVRPLGIFDLRRSAHRYLLSHPICTSISIPRRGTFSFNPGTLPQGKGEQDAQNALYQYPTSEISPVSSIRSGGVAPFFHTVSMIVHSIKTLTSLRRPDISLDT